MNEHKRPLNRTGQVGLVVLVGSMTAAVFAGGSTAFVAVLTAILGFYLVEHHRDFSLKELFSTKKRETKP